LDETISIVQKLKEEHAKALPKYRYAVCTVTTLKEAVNPIILKLSQEEDNTGMADIEPFYC
jgi:hypothetical protein